MNFKENNFVFLLLLMCLNGHVFSNTLNEGLHIEINIPHALKLNDLNYYREIRLPAYSVSTFKLKDYKNSSTDLGFALIQLNAFEYNITFSFNRTIEHNYHQNGTNLGLVVYEDTSLYALNTNYDTSVWVSLAVMLYNKTAPIPGGCNLESPMKTSPLLEISFAKDWINVDTAPASVAVNLRNKTNICGMNNLTYESFYINLPSNDFTQATYFEFIKMALTYSSLKNSSHINRLQTTLPANRRSYTKQVGRGIVFATVTIDKTNHGYSVYVPALSYSCQPFLWLADCYEFNIPLRVLAIIVSVMMVADIICRFMPLPVKSLICGGIVGAIASIKTFQYLDYNVSQDGIILCVVAFAVTGAVLFVVMSLNCPIVILLFCNFLTGYLLSSIIFTVAWGNYYNVYTINIYLMVSTLIFATIIMSVPAFVYISSITFAVCTLFYSLNTIFGTRWHYSVKHMYYNAFNENYKHVLATSTVDSYEIMVIVIFAVIVAACLYLRSKFNPLEDPIDLHCCGRRSDDSSLSFNDTDRSMFGYRNFTNTRPTITRWTSGDDEVFESPQSNFRFFRLLSSRRT